MKIDYLVSGLRITLDAVNTSPGPRTHILNFTTALADAGHSTRLIVASQMPFMGRFSRIPTAAFARSSDAKLLVADGIRLLCALWTGAHTFMRTIGRPAPGLIYERSAVMQSLSSFHAAKARSFRVVEVNGILSRETAGDRNALKLEGVARAIERHVFRSADLLVAVSENLKVEIIEFAGIASEKIIVVPNGIAEELVLIERNRDVGPTTIGFVGQLSLWQRLDRLVEAIARLRDTLPSDAPLVEIIGDGPARPILEKLIGELGLEHQVLLLGRMPQVDAFARMASWTVGFAGHEKSTSAAMYHSPLKIYEYAGLGLDVVCTDSRDARELAHSGLRVEFYGDERPLDEALIAAIGLPSEQSHETEGRRRSLAESHGWAQRVSLVLDAVRQRSTQVGA